MNAKFYLKNTLLTVEMGLVCLAVVLIRTFSQGSILPRYDVPFLVLMSVIPMSIACYVKTEGEENVLVSVFLAAVTFTVLPLAAGWDTGMSAGKMFVEGAVVFAVTDAFYASIGSRVSTMPKAPFALAANGFLLYLASQCFQNIF